MYETLRPHGAKGMPISIRGPGSSVQRHSLVSLIAWSLLAIGCNAHSQLRINTPKGISAIPLEIQIHRDHLRALNFFYDPQRSALSRLGTAEWYREDVVATGTVIHLLTDDRHVEGQYVGVRADDDNGGVVASVVAAPTFGSASSGGSESLFVK